MRTTFGRVLAGALAAAAALVFASQADAGWRWHGSSGGGWGSSGGYGSSGGWGGSSGGWGGSSGGWGGSSGGWGGSSGGSGGGWHKHKRHHHRGWGGSSGGSWGGSSGGWGGSSGGWGGSSGGSYGGAYYGGGYDAYPAYPVDPSLTVPMQPAPGAPAPGYAPAPGGTLPAPGDAVPGAPAPGAGGAPAPAETGIRRADGLLAVSVPEDAKIFVNGQPTTSTGGSRQYVSRDLAPGYNYTYEVRAEVTRDGRTLEQVKTINVRAGDTASLVFDFPQSRSLETSLTLHVPADAKVYLAGNPTKATGETRIFRTTTLSEGWDNYTVRVELERGGRTLTKEETIRLKAGDAQELSFDFEGDKVASR